jgi:hypothetical protein
LWHYGAAAATVVVLLIVYNIFGFGVPCPFHLLTGLWCPGCGSFRAINALLHGQSLAALGYNLLVVFLLPALAVLLVRDAVHTIRGTTPRRTGPAVAIALAVVPALFGILRNLPAFAFLAPAP